MRVLIPNLGSTSLKYQLLDTETEAVLARGKIERIGGSESVITCWEVGCRQEARRTERVPDHRAAITILLNHLNATGKQGDIAAVGFKAVHGGPRFCGSFLVDPEILAAMEEFIAAAPVHNPLYIQAMQTFREALPGVPLVAVFETGFHATIPEHASVYGVPYEWREKYGVRRYGFHGASHRYIAQRVPELICRPVKGLRLVSCHLGGSSSVTAILDGQSVDTTMGFSPQSGLEQSSRCGDLDPFALIQVMEKERLIPADAGSLLCTQGGLLGISGISAHLQDVEKAAKEGNRRAELAIAAFIYEIKKHVGAYSTVLGGLDTLAFAGGIGENSSMVRERVCGGLEFLGIHLNQAANRADVREDRVISLPCSRVAVAVVFSNEELVVARETVAVLARSS